METYAHPFIPQTSNDARAPCPALNMLANHGYIPRNGRNISFIQLVRALHEVYNLSYLLAILLSAVGFLFCGHAFTLSLHDLAEHNKIEHDGSLVHDDCSPGQKFAPTSPNKALLHTLLGRVAPGHGLSLSDFAEARAYRESKISSPLSRSHSLIANGESALTWLILRNQRGEVPIPAMQQWYGDERMPSGWERPTKPIGLRLVHSTAGEVENRVKKCKGRTS